MLRSKGFLTDGRGPLTAPRFHKHLSSGGNFFLIVIEGNIIFAAYILSCVNRPLLEDGCDQRLPPLGLGARASRAWIAS